MSKKNVSASIVRAWGRENIDSVPEAARKCLGENARGRLHPDLTAAYSKANKGKGYTPKVAEAQTVTVPVTGLDKAGRKTTRPVTMTTGEARTALGQPTDRKGRLPERDLSDVLSQVEAAKVADQFSADPA